MKKAVSIPPTGIRFDSNIKGLLKIAAKREGRSVNSEVIKRIEKSLKEDGYIKA